MSVTSQSQTAKTASPTGEAPLSPSTESVKDVLQLYDNLLKQPFQPMADLVAGAGFEPATFRL